MGRTATDTRRDMARAWSSSRRKHMYDVFSGEAM
jgi:hypothetical protein